MRYRFFQIPVREPGPDTDALNRFLGQHRILSVERQLVADGQMSFWALSVVYTDLDSAPGPAEEGVRGRKAKIDYREVLDEQDFATYAALRSLRKQLAEREGVPAYALFTNEQLAAMVQGLRLALARRGGGFRPMDQTSILSRPLRRRGGAGEKQMAAGVLVGGADAPRRLAGRPTSHPRRGKPI